MGNREYSNNILNESYAYMCLWSGYNIIIEDNIDHSYKHSVHKSETLSEREIEAAR